MHTLTHSQLKKPIAAAAAKNNNSCFVSLGLAITCMKDECHTCKCGIFYKLIIHAGLAWLMSLLQKSPVKETVFGKRDKSRQTCTCDLLLQNCLTTRHISVSIHINDTQQRVSFMSSDINESFLLSRVAVAGTPATAEKITRWCHSMKKCLYIYIPFSFFIFPFENAYFFPFEKNHSLTSLVEKNHSLHKNDTHQRVIYIYIYICVCLYIYFFPFRACNCDPRQHQP